jgi:hypothetical protein
MLEPAVARQSYVSAGIGAEAADSARSATGTEALPRGNTTLSIVAPQNFSRKRAAMRD